MLSTLSKVVCVWLLALMVCPFTAPFASIDISAPAGEVSDVKDCKTDKTAGDALALPAFAALFHDLSAAGVHDALLTGGRTGAVDLAPLVLRV